MILFDETIRQSALGRDAVPEAARAQGDHPRDQGRQGREAARAAPRARRSPRASTGCASGWPSTASSARASRSGARRISIGDGMPERVLRLDERARARPLRRALPGGRARPDRRAGGADGRRPHDRGRASKATGRALHAVFTELHDQRVDLEGTLLKPNMVLSGYDGLGARRRRRGRRGDARVLLPPRARGRARGSSSSPAARRTRTRPRT